MNIINKRKITILITLLIVLAGSFMLSVDNVSAASLTETEPNDAFKNANKINVNTRYVGQIATYNDDDYYCFTLKKAGMVNITFDHKNPQDEIKHWEVDLYDSNGKYFYEQDVYGDQFKANTQQMGLPAGTYYVSVMYDGTHTTAHYGLTVNYTATDLWETEYNDNKLNADPISVNKKYTGNLYYGLDEDYYKVNVPSDGTIEIVFEHEYITTEKNYWNIELYDEYFEYGDKPIAESSSSGPETTVSLMKMGLPAGIYYVKVDYSWYDESNYTVEVRHTPSTVWETEYNDTKSTADIINLDTEYYGNLYKWYSDIDYYKFTTTGNGTVTVDFKHDKILGEEEYADVVLLDSEDNELIYISSEEDVLSVQMITIGLEPGTYYLVIIPQSQNLANYSFVVDFEASDKWETENNNMKVVASKITTNKKYYGNITIGDDEDYYRLDLTSEQSVTVNFKHPLITKEEDAWEIALLNAEGDIIEYGYVSTDKTSTNLKTRKLIPGTYYIYVAPCNVHDWYSETYTINALVPATAAPKTVTTKLYGYDDVKVSWSKVSGATSYVVYYKTLSQDYWTKLGTTTGTSMKKANLKDGKTYKFRVVPYKKLTDGTYSGKPGVSKNTYTLRQLAAPKVVKKGLKVKASWGKVNGADGYQVVQYKLKKGKYVKVKGFYTKNTYKLFTAKKGTKFYYKVRAYDNVNGTKIFAPYSKMKGFKR